MEAVAGRPLTAVVDAPQPMRSMTLREMAISSETLLEAMDFSAPACLVHTNYFELDPVRAAGSMKGLYVTGVHRVEAVELAKLPPRTELITVGGENFIPVSDGHVLSDQLPGKWNLEELPDLLVKASGRVEVSGEAVLIARVGFPTWGHWLCELLPKLICVEAAYPGRFRYVLPEAMSRLGMLRSMRESVEYYGVGSERWILAKPNTVHQFSELYAVSPVWGKTHKIHPGVVDLMRARLPAHDHIARRPTRTALLRTESKTRNLANVVEILNELAGYGFCAVELANLPFHEQIEVFAASETIVSILGSGLAGLAYAPAQVKVMTLAPHDWTDLFFFALMQNRNALLADIRGTRCKADDRSPMHASFTVSPEGVERGLQALIGR
jgi:hypothetical protein